MQMVLLISAYLPFSLRVPETWSVSAVTVRPLWSWALRMSYFGILGGTTCLLSCSFSSEPHSPSIHHSSTPAPCCMQGESAQGWPTSCPQLKATAGGCSEGWGHFHSDWISYQSAVVQTFPTKPKSTALLLRAPGELTEEHLGKVHWWLTVTSRHGWQHPERRPAQEA